MLKFLNIICNFYLLLLYYSSTKCECCCHLCHQVMGVLTLQMIWTRTKKQKQDQEPLKKGKKTNSKVTAYDSAAGQRQNRWRVVKREREQKKKHQHTTINSPTVKSFPLASSFLFFYPSFTSDATRSLPRTIHFVIKKRTASASFNATLYDRLPCGLPRADRRVAETKRTPLPPQKKKNTLLAMFFLSVAVEEMRVSLIMYPPNNLPGLRPTTWASITSALQGE